ncbi:hypothetical protein SDC9_103534 [bioreactor metagenome]|uniref:Uncharacterized protein n=1 Tax=bioreactor metagenome TaxID=1076179 RepID=A0A645AUC9_9ZZZZ
MIEAVKSAFHGFGAEQAAIPLLEVIIGRLASDFSKMPAHRPHIGVNGHAVVVQNHNQRFFGGSCIVQPLIGKSAGQRPIPDKGQNAVVLPLQCSGPGHTQRHGNGVGGVARHKRVVLALIGLWKARQAAELPQGAEQLFAPRQRLVNIALVPHVEHQPVAGGVEHPMDCHRQLHHAKIGGHVSAGLGNLLNQKSPQLVAQRIQLPAAQRFHVRRRIDGFKNHRCLSFQKLRSTPALHLEKRWNTCKSFPARKTTRVL